MRTMTLSIALAILVCQAAPCSHAAPEWPCFHGPSRDNRSTETGLLKQWPEGGPTLLWTAEGLGKGYSSVSVAGGRVYTAGMVDKETYVIALGPDGKEAWRARNGKAWESTRRFAAKFAGARSTPTCDAGRVYHLGERGRLAAFDARTGEEIWHRDFLEQYGGKIPKFGFSESVLIDGDKLYCCPAGTKGFMVCLEKKDGKLAWAAKGIQGTAGYCSPVIAKVGGVRQVLSMSSDVVFGVDVRDGKLLWSTGWQNPRNNNATDPIVHNGHVYASSGYGRGSLVLEIAGGQRGVNAKKIWDGKQLDNQHGGVVLVDGHLYGSGHNSQGWFCLEFMTGKQLWNSKGKGSLTYADGMLYCLDEKGTMSLVEATPKAYRAVSTFKAPEGGRGMHWAHPVVCDGRLYIRHTDKLFAYDVRAK